MIGCDNFVTYRCSDYDTVVTNLAHGTKKTEDKIEDNRLEVQQ